MSAAATLGEGPVWDSVRRVCWWVDIVEGSVHRFDPATGEDHALSVGQMVGALALREDGELVLAAQHGFVRLDPDGGRVSPLPVDLELEPGVRFNDGKCDSGGRFWAGTMALDAAPGRGTLFCLWPDGRVQRVLEGVTISNGLAWAPTDDTLYYIDTPTRCVVAFDFDRRTAEIANRRVVVRVPEDLGVPDGMTIDREGMLWVAHWGGSAVVRWNPSTGQELSRVGLPVEQVTSCTFGGERLDRLFITTAREGLSDVALSRQPLAGGLFSVYPGVQGFPPHRFGAAGR